MLRNIKGATLILIISLISGATIYAQCPPEHIRSALNSYGHVKFVESAKKKSKISRKPKLVKGQKIRIGGSACPVAFNSVLVQCISEDKQVIATKTVNLKNQCSPKGCMVDVVELECEATEDGVFEISITPKGGRGGGAVGIGYNE